MRVVSEGKDAAEGKKSPRSCMICLKSSENLFSCPNCKCGLYCSLDCLDQHENHAKYCPIICSLLIIENEKRLAAEIFSCDAEKLPYKMKLKLVRLVGERPVVNIFLDHIRVSALWDTGAMVSVMSGDFLKENFPDVEIRPVTEIIGNNDLTVTLANQGALDIQGVVVLDFGIE